jgi:hypothetical protein
MDVDRAAELAGYLRHRNMRFTAKSCSRRSLAEQIKRAEAEMHRFIFRKFDLYKYCNGLGKLQI